LFSYLSNLKSDGGTDLSTSLTRYANAVRRPGLAIILSDFLTAEEPERGLRAMRARGFDVMLIQVLEPSELRPRFRGTMRLVDSETGEEEEIAVDRSAADEYRQRLEDHSTRIQRFSIAHGMDFIRTATDVSLEDVLLRHLRGGLFLR
jgi:hypothetical protein